MEITWYIAAMNPEGLPWNDAAPQVASYIGYEEGKYRLYATFIKRRHEVMSELRLYWDGNMIDHQPLDEEISRAILEAKIGLVIAVTYPISLYPTRHL